MSSSEPHSPTSVPPIEFESSSFIHQRYQDIALVIFRNVQKSKQQPTNYLTFGTSVQHRAYSSYGNANVIVHKSGNDVTKTDERPIQSTFCVIL